MAFLNFALLRFRYGFRPRKRARSRQRPTADAVNVLMVTSSYPKFPGDVTAPFIESIAPRRGGARPPVDVVLPAPPATCGGGDDEPVRFFPYRYAPRDALEPVGIRAEPGGRRARAAPACTCWRRWSRWRCARAVCRAARWPALRRGARPLGRAQRGAGRGHRARPRRAAGGEPARQRRVPGRALARPRASLARRALRRGGRRDRLQRRPAPARAARWARRRRAPAPCPTAWTLHAFAPRPDAAPASARAWACPRTRSSCWPWAGWSRRRASRTWWRPRRARRRRARRDRRRRATCGRELERQARAAGAPVTLRGRARPRGGGGRAWRPPTWWSCPRSVDRAGNVDGLPNVLLEALAAGTRRGGHARGRHPGRRRATARTACSCPSGDAARAGRGAARACAASRRRAQRLGDEARRHARSERLSWEAAARRLRGRLCPGGSAGRPLGAPATASTTPRERAARWARCDLPGRLRSRRCARLAVARPPRAARRDRPARGAGAAPRPHRRRADVAARAARPARGAAAARASAWPWAAGARTIARSAPVDEVLVWSAPWVGRPRKGRRRFARACARKARALRAARTRPRPRPAGRRARLAAAVR